MQETLFLLENTDDQLRLDVGAILQFVYDKCEEIDFNTVMSRPKNGVIVD